MEKLLQESERNRAGVVPRRVTLHEGKRKTRKKRAALPQPHLPPPILQASRAENTTRKEGSSGCDGNTHADPVKRQKEQVNKPRSETGETHTCTDAKKKARLTVPGIRSTAAASSSIVFFFLRTLFSLLPLRLLWCMEGSHNGGHALRGRKKKRKERRLTVMKYGK